jgi:outer membrane immunogenic protein
MRHSKLLISAAAALGAIFTIGTADAADLPVYTKAAPVVVPIYNWSGIYFGGNIGSGERRYDEHFVNGGAIAGGDLRATTQSAVGGGQVGALYQWGQNVIGVEYAYNSYFGKNNFDTLGFVGIPGGTTTINRTNASSSVQTVGGKLGWAGINNVLFYASGGYAWSSASVVRFGGSPPVTADFTNSSRLHGAYVGAGLDVAVWKGGFADLIAGLEYQHIWLSNTTQGSSLDAFNPGGVNARSVSGNQDILRLKLSVKFNPLGTPVVAKY